MTTRYVVMWRRHASMPVQPVAIFDKLDAAGSYVAERTMVEVTCQATYAGERVSYYIEKVENQQ